MKCYLTSLKEQSIIYLKQNGLHTLTSVLNIQALRIVLFPHNLGFSQESRFVLILHTLVTIWKFWSMVGAGLMTQVWDR